MTAAVGWGATAAFKEDWVWDQAAATYALDPDMAATLRKNNPQVRLSADSNHQVEYRCMEAAPGVPSEMLLPACLVPMCVLHTASRSFVLLRAYCAAHKHDTCTKCICIKCIWQPFACWMQQARHVAGPEQFCPPSLHVPQPPLADP